MDTTTPAVSPRAKRYSAEERAQLVGEYQASGFGIEQFVGGAGISAWTLRRWLQEAAGRRQAGGRSKRARRLLPVTIRPESAEAERIEVIFPGGTTLRVPVTTPVDQVEALISAVRGAC